MPSDKNANQNGGSFPAFALLAKKKKKLSIKSAGRLFPAARGLCQGTDFSPSSPFLPGSVRVCSPFFFLASLNRVLSVRESNPGETDGLAVQDLKIKDPTPC